MKKIIGGVTSQQEIRDCVRVFSGEERKPGADEQEADAELAELVGARQHERRIKVTPDEL